MTIIAKFRCAICNKQRTYQPKTLDTSRVVCMACRKKYPQTAHDVLLRESKYRKVERMAEPQEAA